ncbi:hypothetical protein ACS0TY_018444 [Phlomoides rotata]
MIYDVKKDCARKKVKRVERGRYRRRENAYSKIGIYQVLDSRRRDSSWDDTEFPIK